MEVERGFVNVGGVRLHYRAAGEGLPVLLLHGWPTSSFLWRNVMPPIAEHRRVIALDLPGFGESDKPLDTDYGFPFFRDILDGFLAELGVDRLALVVHDLGGPIGLYWACHQAGRVERIGILNTIVYPELSPAVKAFVLACRMPGVDRILSSSWGLMRTLRLGVSDIRRLREDALDGLRAPFRDDDARRALIRAGYGLKVGGFAEIARWLPEVRVPTHIVYGAQDWILPDIEKTVKRLQVDIPHATVLRLDDCGHFLQEERPDEVGASLAEFLR